MIKLIVKLILPLIALALFPTSMAHATTYRIVVLSSGRTSSDPTHPFIRGLRDGLREAGYVEGNNLLLSIPQNKSIDELRAIMHRHKKDPADVFITIGVTESVIAKDIITESPIVFMPADDPQGAGLIKSFADPGRNLTGLAYQSAEMRGKQLEVFKSIAPSVKEILVLYDGNLKGHSHQKSFKSWTRLRGILELTYSNDRLNLTVKPPTRCQLCQSNKTAGFLFFAVTSLRESSKPPKSQSVRSFLCTAALARFSSSGVLCLMRHIFITSVTAVLGMRVVSFKEPDQRTCRSRLRRSLN